MSRLIRVFENCELRYFHMEDRSYPLFTRWYGFEYDRIMELAHENLTCSESDVDRVRDYLRTKPYFIVIDEQVSDDMWHFIKCLLNSELQEGGRMWNKIYSQDISQDTWQNNLKKELKFRLTLS